MRVELQAAYDAVEKGDHRRAAVLLSGKTKPELTGVIHNLSILREIAKREKGRL